MYSHSTTIKTKEAFATWATEVDGETWRRTCIAVYWCQRNQDTAGLPDDLAYLDWLVRDKVAWGKIHRLITSLRRKRYRANKKSSPS